ncbi:MAG: KTSC domain-containing protein [Burkholderiaceae bacterium]
MAIERKQLRRGGIKSAGYDRNNRILEIEFDNGSIIQHTAVGEEIARRFLASAAPASVYKDTIQDEFTVKRVK